MSREYFEGLGTAVANRTINRPGETWADVADRVALGNSLLDDTIDDYEALKEHISQGNILMSGRHLQHGDKNQPSRRMEVFTNCASAMFRDLTFQLLLSGSGVGGVYDDELMIVDWTLQPTVHCVLAQTHPDWVEGITTQDDVADLNATRFMVPDTREGWAAAIQLLEEMTYEKRTKETLILDFSLVRERNRPIRGMQNRPASGPLPLMQAIQNVNALRLMNIDRWEAALATDHYLAECVLVGGARRAARIAIKHWKDKTIFDFIDVKRPREFLGKSRDEVEELRKNGQYWSRFWSANNSVAVDQEFYDSLAEYESAYETFYPLSENAVHAKNVWDAVLDAQYGDGTGEPGFLNVHRLAANREGLDVYTTEPFVDVNSAIRDEMVRKMAKRVLAHSYQFAVNPCGEISFFLMGAFCVIADTVPFHANSDEDVLEAMRLATRALIRTNLMTSVYSREVSRTNRIGVGLTGLHEWMWQRFGLGFRDAIAKGQNGPLGVSDEALSFWTSLGIMGEVVDQEAAQYSALLGVNTPHTNKTIKPAGTTSKLFGLTEGVHLPAMRKYLRWVQFRNDDPLIGEYRSKGYPVRQLKTYEGTTIVGFPTAPMITQLGMGDKLVTASEATPEEQFRWLQLLEHYWLGGYTGNQISYTLKYRPSEISFNDFKGVMHNNIDTVRCISVMPEVENVSYEYLPEEAISDEEYDRLVAKIERIKEEIDKVHVDCSSGACPVDFR